MKGEKKRKIRKSGRKSVGKTNVEGKKERKKIEVKQTVRKIYLAIKKDRVEQ